MKKILLFAALLTLSLAAKAECQDGPYGLQINGSKVVDAPKFGEPDAQGRVQYKASCVELAAGDIIKLINQSCDATWMVNIDPYGEYQNFDGGKDAGQLTCKKAGSYDFYIKMKANDDLVYIGPGENCGGGQGQGGGDNPGGQGGGQGGGSVEGNPRYYYKGYIDNKDVEPSEATIFDHGVAEIEFSEHAMLFVLYQVDGYPGVQYMTTAWTDGPSHATLVTNGGEKWNCPLGTTQLYLYDNGDGTLELSSEPISGKKLADPQPASGGGQQSSAVDNTTVSAKVVKTIVNGQVVIIKDGVRYNLLGAQLQ